MNKQIKYSIQSNLGKTLENDIDHTNKYNLAHNIAVIYKKPTPIQVVKVSYPARSKAKITEAFYKIPSTTDYNGIYKGFYIDFDAKETNSKTSIPLANIHHHQVLHLNQAYKHGGIAFLIIHLKLLDEYYLIEIQHIIDFWDQKLPNARKSIPIAHIKKNGYQLKLSYNPRLNFIDIVDLIIAKRQNLNSSI